MHSVIERLKAEFNLIKDSNRASGMKAYMKNKFEFYGIPSIERKQVVKKLWQEHKDDIKHDWKLIAPLAWDCEHREMQYAVMDMIGRIEKQLSHEDLSEIEFLITHRSWWDTVDFLASHAVGQILLEDKHLRHKTARRFLAGENMWLHRTALIFQLNYRDNTDEALLFEIIEQSLGSKEFFINKAIGWALRQYSKSNVSAVKGFVKLNSDKMARLSVREASKYLN